MLVYIFILALLTTTNCQNEEEEEDVDEDLPPLPTPRLTIITTLDPPGVTVEWAPVESDDKNPVAGFKAKVWVNEKEKVYHQEEIEGLGKVWTVHSRLVEKDIDKIPTTEPLVQIVGANETKARFENMKLKEDYLIRVQAFNDLAEDGPYSNVLGIKLGAE